MKPLMTIFTAPKPFTDPHIDMIQRNAIRSWLALGEDVEVVLVGDEVGMAEVAAEYGVRHYPQAECNQQGTPLISSIFELARTANQSPLLAYVNADILLLPDFVERARQTLAQTAKFLLVGQRWDLDVNEALDFSPGWPERVRSMVADRGQLHPPAGSDYFIFPRSAFNEVPDFSVGRSGWDNWMIYHAAIQPWPLIDATHSIMIVHENHDYAHLPGGKLHYDLPETQENVRLAGGDQKMFMLLDAQRDLVDGEIRRPRLTVPRLLRRLERWVYPGDDARRGWRWALTRRLRAWRRKAIHKS